MVIGNTDGPTDSDHGAIAIGPDDDTPVMNVDMAPRSPTPPPPYTRHDQTDSTGDVRCDHSRHGQCADMAVGGADAATAIADASPSPKKRRKRTSPGELVLEKHRSAATRHHRTSSEATAERSRWTGGWSGGWECDGRAGRGGWREFMAFDALHA